VTNVTPFGAFVQVEEAVEGLIHASELDADPQTQPVDVLKPGQQVTARVISLDRQRQRMGLSLRRVTEETSSNDGDGADVTETLATNGKSDPTDGILDNSEIDTIASAEVGGTTTILLDVSDTVDA